MASVYAELPAWRTKKSLEEKLAGRAQAAAEAELKKPTIEQLQKMTSRDFFEYCEKLCLSAAARETMWKARETGMCPFDERDYRTIAAQDRVPRSLMDDPPSPRGFWAIDIDDE